MEWFGTFIFGFREGLKSEERQSIKGPLLFGCLRRFRLAFDGFGGCILNLEM